MAGKSFSKKQWLFLAATLLVPALICIALLAGFWMTSLRNRAIPAVEPATMDYCGADLEDLCVLSFGRDGDGNTIINLFVPRKKLPVFYLTIKRRNSESLYVCDKSDDIPNTVWCVGEPLSLEERVEIDVVSKQDDQLLARGRFTITAIFIGSPNIGASKPQSNAATSTLPASSQTDVPPSTPIPGRTEPARTANPAFTPTPSDSYPNYP